MKKNITISIDMELYELLRKSPQGISGAIGEALVAYLDVAPAPSLQEATEKIAKLSLLVSDYAQKYNLLKELDQERQNAGNK